MKSYELTQVADSRTTALDLVQDRSAELGLAQQQGGATVMEHDADGLPAPTGHRYVVLLLAEAGAGAPTSGIWCLYPTRQYRANVDAFRATIPNA